MGLPSIIDTPRTNPESITPEHVRGLSLGKVTEDFGTAGLYVRTIDTLERTGFGDNELVQFCLQLGLMLHTDDPRTNGHYTDHLMRVMLHIIEDFGIRDQNIVAAAPLHDSFEDHPRDLVYSLTGEKPADRDTARAIAREALARAANEEVVSLVERVTNPDVPEGGDKLEVYTRHTTDIVFNSPKGRVLKLSDFLDNAAGNHATVGEKRRKLDEKYIRQYRLHKMGLFLPDSLITGPERQRALHMLTKGHVRAVARLAMDATPIAADQTILGLI